MQLFYTPYINPDHLIIEGQEAKHCAQVLRKSIGDEIRVTDGLGYLYTGNLIEVHKNRCVARIERKEVSPKEAYRLHMAISPVKNTNRNEWFLEKAIEFGIHEISYIQCHHSERKLMKMERLEKIAISAMKQSLHFHLPKLHDLVPFDQWLSQVDSFDGIKLIAHCQEGTKQLLSELKPLTGNILVLIGPEGDFSPVEIEKAKSVGFTEISLGKNRLRTETAGMAVCCLINSLNQHNS